MANQLSAPRVETRAGSPADSERHRFRAAGIEFDRLMRSVVGYLARRCDHVPAARRQAIHDFTRPEARPATLVVVGANLAAIAREPSLPDAALEDSLLQLEAWLHAQRPSPTPSLMALWTAETHAQAPADVDQALALEAIARRDRAALERAITSTTQHLATAKRLLAALMAAHREALYHGGHRRIA